MRLPESSMTERCRELPRTFQNPLVARGADPWFVKDQDTYYFSHVQHEGPHDRTVYVRKFRTITGMRTAEAVPAVTVTDRLHPELWAPELHKLPVKVGREWQQKWYLYVSAADPSGAHRRVYVYEAQTPDPQGPYREKGRICDLDDRWGIDGTVLRHPRGEMYFLWSGEAPEVPGQQNLYIAPMHNPWTLTGRGVCISTPELAWERLGPAPVNEGPAPLVRGDRIHVIYAASHSLTDDYCLGRLTLRKDADPLDPEAWQKAPRRSLGRGIPHLPPHLMGSKISLSTTRPGMPERAGSGRSMCSPLPGAATARRSLAVPRRAVNHSPYPPGNMRS
jgi:GH43 family beta-xylosidase